LHDADDTSAAKLIIKLLQITNVLWINLSICSYLLILNRGDVQEYSFYSSRFPKEDLFTFFAKEKKLPADIVFTLILPFRPASYART
jgi:hypothetical protein